MAAFGGVGAASNAGDINLLGDAERILDLLPAAVYVCDRDGTIVRYNQRAAALWGRVPSVGDATERFRALARTTGPHSLPLLGELKSAGTIGSGEPLYDREILIARPDGTQAIALLSVDPILDHDGKVVGTVNMLIDISDRKQSERSAQMLASIVESSEDAIASKDLNGIIATWNQGAERLFGYTAEEAVGRPMTMLIPPGRVNEEPAILDRIRRGERVEHFETVRQRKDGSLVEISMTISPIRNADDRIVGASNVARDITERKRIEQQNRLLLREMNHRVKNLFSLAAGVVAISARHAKSAKAMAESVRQRISALARAHSLTLPPADAGMEEAASATTLHRLLETMVAAYVGETVEEKRVTLSGPDVAVGGAAVTSLALVFHEMATNAAKYGALAAEDGRIAIAWSVAGDDLELSWRESGGHPVRGAPETTGFGTLLADATLDQFGGRIVREWTPGGLNIHLSIPLARLTS